MFQSIYLRVLNKLCLFVLQISGLWPFSYDSQSKRFKFIWYFTILPILIIGYPLIVIFFWSKLISKEIYIKNTVVKLLSISFITFNAINFVILFVCQYLKFKEIKELIFKSLQLIRELNTELDKSEFKYGKLLLKFSMKTFVFMFVLVVSIIYSMKRITKFHDNYLMYVMSTLPNVLMKFHPDFFYGGLMLVRFYLTEINRRVSSILTKASDLSENQDVDEEKSYQKMISFCELSDQLDRLCVLQCTMIEISESFSRICSFQITLWLALSLCLLVVNTFLEYALICLSIKTDQFQMSIFINDLVAICLTISEVYLTTGMSGSVINEVCTFL